MVSHKNGESKHMHTQANRVIGMKFQNYHDDNKIFHY